MANEGTCKYFCGMRGTVGIHSVFCPFYKFLTPDWVAPAPGPETPTFSEADKFRLRGLGVIG